jgi:hypothetical protein
MDIIKRLCVAMLLPMLAAPAYADDHDRREGFHDGRRDDRYDSRHEGRYERGREGDMRWRGDIRRFHEHDVDVWRRGHWYHGHHLGRNGWWWIVGGVWYFYPTPVYPYPDPFLPPGPPVAVAPPVQAPPQPQQYWYYCRNPEGYYPYVPQCRVPWEAVPANSPSR